MSKSRFTPKLHIKKGDKVRVIAGASKNEEGIVLELFPSKNRATVEGVNIRKKHTKPTNENPGGINDITAPIHVSNLMVIDASGKASKVGKREENGAMVRFSKKTGETIK